MVIKVAEIYSAIGLGPLLSIIGLVMDGLGVIISLRPYAFQTRTEIAYETEAILTAEWDHNRTEQQWLSTEVGKTRLMQRRSARLGLFFLAGGFFLQAIGNYIWASS